MSAPATGRDRRTRSEATLLVLTVMFTVLMFFPAVPASVPGKLKVAGAIVAISWLVAIWRTPNPALIWRDHRVITSAAVALPVWMAASTLWAADRSTALSTSVRMATEIALMVVVYTVARGLGGAKVLMLAYCVGGALSIAYGVILKPGPPIEGIVFDPTRLYGGMGEPNDLGAVLLPGIALCLFAIPVMRTTSGRLSLVALAIVLTAGLALSQSRGAFVAAAVMVVVATALAGRLRTKIAAVLGVVIVSGVGYYFLLAPEAVQHRVNSLLRTDVYGGIADGSGRRELWQRAIDLIKAQPLHGVGARNYRAVTGESLVVHNTYLEVLAEVGLVGLLLFLFVIVGVIKVLVSALRRGDTGQPPAHWQARGVLVGLAGLLTAYVFISGEFQHQLWWLLGWALACGPRDRNGTVEFDSDHLAVAPSAGADPR